MSAIKEVSKERKLQDREWGGPAHDDGHTYDDWADILRSHTARLYRHLRDGNTVALRRRAIVVAALAVALVDSIDRYEEYSE